MEYLQNMIDATVRDVIHKILCCFIYLQWHGTADPLWLKDKGLSYCLVIHRYKMDETLLDMIETRKHLIFA